MEDSLVIVVGLGGVGSHAANMLVRSGITKIRLIDFDQVTLSSLNRHAVAAMDDVGISKAETMKKKLLKIVPWCDISARTEMFRGTEADQLLSGNPAFVLDCIDDVNTKADLIAYCAHNNIKCLTSMGAGGKVDPTRLRIAPLSDCVNDPLATKIKWKLKKLKVSSDDVISVFSIERQVCDLLPLDDEQANAPQDYGNVDYMRLRVIPVLGTSPSIFGQAMASYVLCALAGKPYEPEQCERMSRALKHKMRQTFQNNETRRFGSTGGIDMDEDDLEFIVTQVWHARCAVTGRRFGGHATLVLTRWDPEAPPTPYNLVLVMIAQAQIIAEQGTAALPGDVQARIQERLEWARRICEHDFNPRSWGVLPPGLESSEVVAKAEEKSLSGGLLTQLATALSAISAAVPGALAPQVPAWARQLGELWVAVGLLFGGGYLTGQFISRRSRPLN